MGHSYGGPVVARMAIDYPDRVAGLVLLASSADPEPQWVKPIQRFAKWPVIKWLVPGFTYSTNEEILALQQSLAEADNL